MTRHETEVQIPAACRDLFERALLGSIATTGADGSPNVTPVWIMRRGNRIIFNTNSWRGKTQNLQRDPRVAICVLDDQDPMRYLQVQGRADLSTERARETIEELSRKYLGKPYRPLKPGEERVDVVVMPTYIDYHPDADMAHVVRITSQGPRESDGQTQPRVALGNVNEAASGRQPPPSTEQDTPNRTSQ